MDQLKQLILRRKGPIFIGLVAIIILIIIVHYFAGSGHKNLPSIPVEVTPALKKNVTVSLHENGNIEANINVSVKSQVDGVIQSVHFNEGQEVQQGDLLFVIDPRPYQVALEHAEATLAKDTAQLQYQQAILARYKQLIAKNYVSKDNYEQAISLAASAAATVKSDEAAVASAKLNLEYCYIRSPIGGRTGARQVDEGNLVKTANTQTLVVIQQVHPISVAFSVPERYLNTLRAQYAKGAVPVLVTIPPANTYREAGQLSLIDNTINSTTGTFLLKADFSNSDDQLWPGQFVNVIVPISQLADATVVPSAAVQKGQKGDYVFVINGENTAEYRTIKTGPTMDNETVIESGVAPGERVVTVGQFQLQDGSPVKVQQPIRPFSPNF